MSAQLAPPSVTRFFDNNGAPLFLGKLTTFIAGSTTPQATYVDSTQTTQNTNPIILNFRGECQLWLDPTKAYKFLLQDSQGNTIPGWPVDNITIGNANPSYNIIPTVDNLYTLGSPSFAWANVYVGPNHAPILDTQSGIVGYYPRTAIELTAGSVPINFSYPSGYPERYGNNTNPGTTDMTAAVQAALNVGRYGGVEVILGGSPYYANASGYSWPYLVTSVLNCTPVNSSTPIGFTVRCVGHNLADTNNAPFYPPIIARHNGVAVFDATGSYGITWENVSVGSDNTTFPKTAWLIARSSAGNSQFHRFLNCRAVGKFSVAVLYNYGSEDCTYEGFQFIQLAGTAGVHCVLFTGQNIAGLSSPYATIATGVQSTIDHTFLGGTFANITSNGTSDCFHLEGAINNFRLEGQWMTVANGGVGGRALVYCDTTNNPINNLHIDGLQVETQGTTQQQYGVFVGGGSNTCVGIYIANSYMANNTAYMQCGTGQTIQQLTILSPTQGSVNGGFISPGTVQLSTFITDSMNLAIGNSTNNVLIGESSRWTITTRTQDTWLDSILRTWTPGTGALTVVGALTVSNARVHFMGQRVIVSVQLQAATSIACAAGTAITGLPIGSTIQGECRVTNCSTPATVGSGTVSGTSMVLPAIGATGGLLLFVAEYFCS